jgi:hypothetical protein
MPLNRFQEYLSVELTEKNELVFLEVSQQNWPTDQVITAVYDVYKIKWLAVNDGTDCSE